jgi:hypothetical protein
MFNIDSSNLPGQIEAALHYLRYTQEVVSPKDLCGPPLAARALNRTELEVKDSALTVLLEYFNQPASAPTGFWPNLKRNRN